jgi:transposase
MSYDIKFRRHVLKVWDREGLSFVGAGERFGISKQTVYNWTKRLEEKKNRLRPAIKIDMDKLKQDVEAYSNAYCYERAKRLGVSTRCVGYALKRLGVTYKKNFQASQSQFRKKVYFLPGGGSL